MKHNEVRSLPYHPRDLFNLVLDVESYPEFIPGCKAARITSIDEDFIRADLVVGYMGKSIKYTSKIITDVREEDSIYSISVSLVEGPFKKLDNEWKFTWDNESKNTIVEFGIDFEMNSTLLNEIISLMFEKLLLKMIDSFEQRAKQNLQKSNV